jgi:predicted nucleic acid-binding protein
MAAERRSFHDPLESIIYWDASFAVAHFLDTQSYHTECVAFRHRLEAEGILSVSSDFTHNELAFRVIQSALAAEGRRTGQPWHVVYRQHPDLVLATMPQVNANRTELDRLTLQLPLPETVKVRAFQLMQGYALLPTDAYHLATALEAGVNAFVSLDEDFLRVDGIIVYTCRP